MHAALAAQRHAPQKFAARESGIHQQSRSGTGDERAVALAPARQHRDRNCHNREHKPKRGSAVVTNWLTAVEKATAKGRIRQALNNARLFLFFCTTIVRVAHEIHSQRRFPLERRARSAFCHQSGTGFCMPLSRLRMTIAAMRDDPRRKATASELFLERHSSGAEENSRILDRAAD